MIQSQPAEDKVNLNVNPPPAFFWPVFSNSNSVLIFVQILVPKYQLREIRRKLLIVLSEFCRCAADALHEQVRKMRRVVISDQLGDLSNRIIRLQEIFRRVGNARINQIVDR